MARSPKFKADGDQQPECHPAQNFDPNKAPETAFADPWIYLAILGFGLGMQVLRKLGWAVSQTSKLDGLTGFPGRNSSTRSAPHLRGFGSLWPPGRLEMHQLKPIPRAKKGQEVPGTDYTCAWRRPQKDAVYRKGP